MSQEESGVERHWPNADAQGEHSAVYPTSIRQQHLWFLDKLDRAASAAYHMAAGYYLQGRLNRQAMRAALDAIVARHEA
jgi:hypothetical protein